MTVQIMQITSQQWTQILEILGTGQFIRIEFRPPTEDEEVLGTAVFGKKWGWWICEAEYMDLESKDGYPTRCHSVVRKIPFLLHEPPVD